MRTLLSVAVSTMLGLAVSASPGDLVGSWGVTIPADFDDIGEKVVHLIVTKDAAGKYEGLMLWRWGSPEKVTDFKVADGKFSLERDLVEGDTAWYVAVLKDAESHALRAAASPIYFRGADFKPPEVVPLRLPLPKRIKERILYLTPEETDADAWWDELKGLLKEAAE